MLAYVRDIQRCERDEDVETLTHQKWSGAEFVDQKLNTVVGGLSSNNKRVQNETLFLFVLFLLSMILRLSNLLFCVYLCLTN